MTPGIVGFHSPTSRSRVNSTKSDAAENALPVESAVPTSAVARWTAAPAETDDPKWEDHREFLLRQTELAADAAANAATVAMEASERANDVRNTLIAARGQNHSFKGKGREDFFSGFFLGFFVGRAFW